MELMKGMGRLSVYGFGFAAGMNRGSSCSAIRQITKKIKMECNPIMGA